MGGVNIRKHAQDRGKKIVTVPPSDIRVAGENIRQAAGALIQYGKGAYADIMHSQAEASEYVLQDEHLDIVRPGAIKTIPYSRIQSVQVKGDKATLTLDRGTVVIKPFAYIVAGRAKVAVGWSRNGMEVPFDLLIDEIAARSDLEVSEE
jgi:hypothetical protein